MQGLLEEYKKIFKEKKKVKRSYEYDLTCEFIALNILLNNWRKKMSSLQVAEIAAKDPITKRHNNRIGIACHKLAKDGIIQSFKSANEVKYKALLSRDDIRFYDQKAKFYKGMERTNDQRIGFAMDNNGGDKDDKDFNGDYEEFQRLRKQKRKLPTPRDWLDIALQLLIMAIALLLIIELMSLE